MLDTDSDTPEWARLALGDAIIVLKRDSYNNSDETMTRTAIDLVREGRVRDLTWTGLHLEVYDIPGVCRRLKEGGGQVLSSPRRARRGTAAADVADPDGNVFIFYSVKRQDL